MVRTRTDDVATTTVPPRTPGPDASSTDEGHPAVRSGRWLQGIRARVLFWSIATLALTVATAVIAVRQVLLAQVDDRIDEALIQEAKELDILAKKGIDPVTGERFGGDVERIFEVFLQRNVLEPTETYMTFIGGRFFERRPLEEPRLDDESEIPPQLTLEPAFAELVSAVERPDRGQYEAQVGRVEYLALPVQVNGETLGVFVAAFLRDFEAAEVEPATRAAAGVGLLTMLIGSLVAWRVAEGMLRPVRATTDTARRISTADLTRRIPVSGHDEVAELGRTFNELLDKLEEAFETQRRFVNDAGHELRTPITIVRGHLELLEDDPEERDRTLALVQDELDRMQRIVLDLLTLAKSEQADFLSLEVVDLTQLTDDLDEKIRPLGERDWRVDRAGGGAAVADRQRLTQAMIQFAQNAVQHTTEGDEIGIGSAVRDGEARLWVRDTGEGIPQRDLERIFGRFARGRHKRGSEGAGLGLSIVRVIAEAHGGRIEVDSVLGEGSTFALVIPLDQPHDGEEP